MTTSIFKKIPPKKPALYQVYHVIIILSLICFSQALYADAGAGSDDVSLHEAVKAGDLEKIKTLVTQKNERINQPDENGMTPLHWAAANGHLDIARFLVKKGANPNAKDKDGDVPLHVAAARAKYDITSLLLKNGASPLAKNMYLRTPMHFAAQARKGTAIIKLLIDAGADLNARDFEGYTPLRNCNWYGITGSVNLLLEHHATLPTDKEEIKSFLHYAARNGHMELLKKFEKNGAGISQPTDQGGTLLHSAAEGGSTLSMTYLLEKKLPINGKNSYGMTPLHLAASGGHTAAAELLLSKQAQIDLRCKQGKSALNYATGANRRETAKLLVAKGAKQGEQVFPKLTHKYLSPEPTGKNAKIFALGIISTLGHEHSAPVFSPDGREVYWTPTWKGPIQYMKYEKGRWTRPRNAPFSSKYGDGEPAFSPDGEGMFFLSYRPLKSNEKAKKENIWTIQRKGSGWGKPKPVGDAVNSLKLHWMVSAARSGNLYFGSDKAGGSGLQDIYVSPFLDGKYTTPKNLGPTVNSPFYEHSPYIAPDESYLIFTRIARGKSEANSDLFICFRKKDGSWTEAKNMGEPVNTPYSELCPSISPDGKYLFFVSMQSGTTDVYWINSSFIKSLRPE